MLDDCEESTVRELFKLLGSRSGRDSCCCSTPRSSPFWHDQSTLCTDGSVSVHEVAEVMALLGLAGDRHLVKSHFNTQRQQGPFESIGDALQVTFVKAVFA